MISAEASHILVNSKGEAATIRKHIVNAKKQLKEFEKRARKHSTCPSSRRGGDLGTFGRGQMAAGFEIAVKKMDIGTVSEPVKTRYGYHLIWLHSRID
ncbi:MAG: peptidylprolyl isomerase [Candidatus Thalassarchaeaceae archaeon]|nr:peptidylprolyl isomerase [Candidatus Thalassarchaeaceae archaeon]